MSTKEQPSGEILTRIAGNDDDFTLEHQCFNGMCFFTAILIFVCIPFNYLIGLDLVINLYTFLFGCSFCLFYYFSRFKGIFSLIYWILLFCSCLFISVLWFYTGGISGTATIITLMILAVINLITSEGRRLLSITILSITLGILYRVEYARPDLVLPYKNDRAMFIDHYATFLIAVLIISFVIHFIMQHFRSERKKVKDNEEKLKAILDNIPDPAWLKDIDSKFTKVNQPFSDVCGMPVKKITGKTVMDVWPRDLAELFEKEDAGILNTGNSICREQFIFHPERGERRYEVIKKPTRSKSGRITGIVGTARDITARCEYEDRLRKYERIVGTSMDQMALVNTEYRYEAANEACFKAHACNENDFTGHTMADIYGRHCFETKIQSYVEKAFHGEAVNFQEEILFKGTGRRNVDISYFPHKNDQGITTSIVMHIKDITDQKQMERRLVQSQRLEAMGTLAGGIAHDFNNILSGILGYAQLGQLHIDDPGKVNRHLDNIIKGSQRAGELVQQILTFSRQHEYEKHPLKVSVVIKEALKLIRASIPAFIDIKTDIRSTSDILADPTQIHQIIMNLCTNAYQAMQETNGTLTVVLKDIRITDPGDIKGADLMPGRYLKLEVGDSGHGMDEQTMAKIFEPYFTTKEMGKGTGMGLALVHGIVKEHDGFVQVESEVGKGSCFRIYFPVIENMADQMDVSEPDNAFLSKGTETIMIVDDDESILFSTRELLEDWGYQVLAFENGRQAFDEFKKTPDLFDLVLTDMTMPEMTGDQLAQKILEIRPDLPVILCTGYSDRVSEERAKQIGIKKFVQKPYISLDLTSLIREVLELGSIEGHT